MWSSDAFSAVSGAIEFFGERDNPANLYSLIGLLVLNVAGFVLNYRRLSIGFVLIWAVAIGMRF